MCKYIYKSRREFVLEGIKLIDLKKNPDERGLFAEIFRDDWENFLEGDKIVQANLSLNYPSIVRAWHKHERGQVDYFVVLKGAIKICAFDEKTKELDEITLSDENLKIARIPGKYWHGTKSIGNEQLLLIYFVNKLYDYKNPDEKRRPWNDPDVIPSNINGKKDDSRVGKPYDWFAIPYK
jgi:dTDP-4-dehydrorhamnose 3,5-epimerase